MVETKQIHKMVITLPLDVYFELKNMAGELTVKQYIELLLRNVAKREVKLGGLRKRNDSRRVTKRP